MKCKKCGGRMFLDRAISTMEEAATTEFSCINCGFSQAPPVPKWLKEEIATPKKGGPTTAHTGMGKVRL